MVIPRIMLIIIISIEICEEQGWGEVVIAFINFCYDRSSHCQITTVFKLTCTFMQYRETWKHTCRIYCCIFFLGDFKIGTLICPKEDK